MKTNIGIQDKNRKEIIEILNQLLSDEYVLYTKTRNFHWNVTGSDFSELHKFFEAQYIELNDVIDAVAERARALNGVSFGSLNEFLKNTSLKEVPGGLIGDQKMVATLLGDHETIIRSLREHVDTVTNFKDAGTADFLTGLMEQHEKMAWMLRSYLK